MSEIKINLDKETLLNNPIGFSDNSHDMIVDILNPIDKILTIYRKDIIKNIEKVTEEDIKEIREKSNMGKIYKDILKYADKKIKEKYPDNFDIMKNRIYISFDVDELTQREVENILEERQKAIKELDNVLKDVQALLELADTFEQKMEILKNYSIIDEDGMLV